MQERTSPPPNALLRHRGLITHGLPVPRAANPHAGITIGTAEVFPQLMSLYVGPGRYYSGVAVDAHHHVTHVDGVIAKLAALASRESVLLGRHLTEWRDGDVILGEGSLGEVGIAMEAGFPGLPFHIHDFSYGCLIGGIHGGPRMRRRRLCGERRERHDKAPQ